MRQADGTGLAAQTTLQYLRSLRIASVAVTAAVLLISMPLLFVGYSVYRLAWGEVAGYVLLCLIVVIEAMMIWRSRSWGRWRWPVVLAVLAVSVLARIGLPPEMFAPADWAFGCVGWVGVMVLFDQVVPLIAGFVAAHIAINGVIIAVTVDHLDSDAFLTFGLLVIAISSFPLAVCAAILALRKVAGAATAAMQQDARLRIAQAVATRLHEDQKRRYDDLAEAVRPLLAGLADESIDPSDELTQKRCAIEAARMRRLFAEADDVDDPLLHELRACIDMAERRGVVVSLATRGSWPNLTRTLRRSVTDAPLAALATAASSARVTIVGTTAGLSVSVVADAKPLELASDSRVPGVDVSIVSDESELWVEARWIPNR